MSFKDTSQFVDRGIKKERFFGSTIVEGWLLFERVFFFGFIKGQKLFDEMGLIVEFGQENSINLVELFFRNLLEIHHY